MARKRKRQLTPKAVGIKEVSTDSLIPNPHNPRMLFDRKPLGILRSSIEKVGILVPLTVYWSDTQNTYVILDGQRRWMCAQGIGLKSVPVNQIAEPDLVQNIVTMFQIHKLREDWELMPTALKLEVLMRELEEVNDRKLADLTGLDQAVVARCKKLLSYSKRYQDLTLDPDPEKRVKADFFIELYAVRNDRFVNKMPWFKRDKFTARMLEKYQKKTAGLKSVTDFRLMKQHITNARKANRKREITKRLREFSSNDSLALDHLVIKEADVSQSANKLVLQISRLRDELSNLEVQDYFGEELLWVELEKLVKTILKKLAAAERRPVK